MFQNLDSGPVPAENPNLKNRRIRLVLEWLVSEGAPEPGFWAGARRQPESGESPYNACFRMGCFITYPRACPKWLPQKKRCAAATSFYQEACAGSLLARIHPGEHCVSPLHAGILRKPHISDEGASGGRPTRLGLSRQRATPLRGASTKKGCAGRLIARPRLAERA